MYGSCTNIASMLFVLGYIVTGSSFSKDVGDEREEDLKIRQNR